MNVLDNHEFIIQNYSINGTSVAEFQVIDVPKHAVNVSVTLNAIA